MRTLPEEHFYYQRRSNLSIYRFEDAIFYLFPHMATHKRKAANTREIWLNNDPFAKQSFANVPTMKDAKNPDVTGIGSGVDMDSALDGQPSISGIIGHNDSSKYFNLNFRAPFQCIALVSRYATIPEVVTA